jgi:hypothetical protein
MGMSPAYTTTCSIAMLFWNQPTRTVEPGRFQVSHYSAYFRKVRGEFEEAWRSAGATYREPVEHCDVCSWFSLCDERWRRDDHLSLVAGITRNQRKVLTGRDVNTVASLARLPVPLQPPMDGIGETALLSRLSGVLLRYPPRPSVIYSLTSSPTRTR